MTDEKTKLLATILAIGELLIKTRMDVATEKTLQNDIETAFKQRGIPYERELPLSPTDIPDFMVEGLAIEVKIGGTNMPVYRQCERYCTYDQVKGIMLVTTKPFNLPEYIKEKPAYVVKLGTAWL